MNGAESRPPRRSFDRVAVVLLFLIGAWVLLAPSFLGWGYVEEHGLTDVFLRVLVGFLFFFVASQILEKNRLRHRVDELHEAFNMLLYGKSYRSDREAVRILIRSLRSEDEKIRSEAWSHLKRLTGQNFALDPEVWESWWNVNEKRFARKSKRPEE